MYKPLRSDSMWMGLVSVLFANVQYNMVILYIEIIKTWLWTSLSYSKHTEVIIFNQCEIRVNIVNQSGEVFQMATMQIRISEMH